jgi:uncharacterized damage-inducible protein DinB
MNEPVYLKQIFEGWGIYQQQLTTVIVPLTPTQLRFQIAPHLRSIMTLTAHIIAARVWWFHFVMQEGSDALKPMVKWDDNGEPTQTAVSLVTGLNQTWDVIENGLSRWTQADLDELFHHRWPGTTENKTFSRQWIIWHVLEHDLHHGGELSFSLGAAGLPAINL